MTNGRRRPSSSSRVRGLESKGGINQSQIVAWPWPSSTLGHDSGWSCSAARARCDVRSCAAAARQYLQANRRAAIPLANSTQSFGSVTKTLHWLTALLVLTAIPLGWFANQLPYDTSEEVARKAFAFSLHKTVGVATFFVGVTRILWALTQARPAPLHPDRRAETWLAGLVHWLLYGSLVLVPLTGWIHHAASEGFAPIWWPFGQDLLLVPKDEALSAAFAGLHIVTKWVLIGAIGLHVAGALKHHVVDRDGTLRRMLPGDSTVPTVADARHPRSPVVAALALWFAAIGIGGVTGAYDRHAAVAPPAAATLEGTSTGWEVQDGALAIAIQQLGSTVEGSFSDWTAAIAFKPRDEVGPAGTVDVTVSIGSLTLGSVTAQALGAEFFDAAAFSTARFKAEILRTADGYVAQGPLTIRDQSVPVTLPFSIEIFDGTATATGQLDVNRLDFQIGQTYPDESAVGFTVRITFALTATRNVGS